MKDLLWNPEFYTTPDSLRARFPRNKNWNGYCVIEPNYGKTPYTKQQLKQIERIVKKIIYNIVNNNKPKHE